MTKIICTECGNETNEEDSGICVSCEEPVCENCQAEYTQFSQIDFPLHQMCLESYR